MRSNNRLLALAAALGFWLIFSGLGSFLWIQTNTRILAIALLAFTVTLAITSLFRFSGLMATILAILTYGFAEIRLNGVSADVIWPIGIFSIGLIIASLLANAVAREAMNMNRQLDSDKKLIDELRLFDTDTGLMRYLQALRLFKSEIVRSQRYEKNVCVFLVQIDNLDEIEKQRGATGMEETKRLVVGALMSSVRAIDIPFGGEKFGAYLPETNLEGAKIVMDRLINALVNKARVPASIGIAEFPNDGTTEIELVQAAEAAMQVAATSGKPFVQYSQISKAV